MARSRLARSGSDRSAECGAGCGSRPFPDHVAAGALRVM